MTMAGSNKKMYLRVDDVQVSCRVFKRSYCCCRGKLYLPTCENNFTVS